MKKLKGNACPSGLIGVLFLSACGADESSATLAPTVTVAVSPANIATGQERDAYLVIKQRLDVHRELATGSSTTLI